MSFSPSFFKVTSGMVISTFLSAPIMYVSAWLLTIPLMDPTPLVAELENVSFNISIVSLIALVNRLLNGCLDSQNISWASVGTGRSLRGSHALSLLRSGPLW